MFETKSINKMDNCSRIQRKIEKKADIYIYIRDREWVMEGKYKKGMEKNEWLIKIKGERKEHTHTHTHIYIYIYIYIHIYIYGERDRRIEFWKLNIYIYIYIYIYVYMDLRVISST